MSYRSSFVLFLIIFLTIIVRISKFAPMEHVYVLFEMLKVKEVYIVYQGQLQGVINWSRMLNNLKTQRQQRMAESRKRENVS